MSHDSRDPGTVAPNQPEQLGTYGGEGRAETMAVRETVVQLRISG
jgi:hypothetical protein